MPPTPRRRRHPGRPARAAEPAPQPPSSPGSTPTRRRPTSTTSTRSRTTRRSSTTTDHHGLVQVDVVGGAGITLPRYADDAAREHVASAVHTNTLVRPLRVLRDAARPRDDRAPPDPTGLVIADDGTEGVSAVIAMMGPRPPRPWSAYAVPANRPNIAATRSVRLMRVSQPWTHVGRVDPHAAEQQREREEQRTAGPLIAFCRSQTCRRSATFTARNSSAGTAV